MQKQRKVSPKSPIAEWKMMERLSRAYCFQSMPVHAALQRHPGQAAPPAARPGNPERPPPVHLTEEPPMAGYNAVPKLIVALTMPMTLGRSALFRNHLPASCMILKGAAPALVWPRHASRFSNESEKGTLTPHGEQQQLPAAMPAVRKRRQSTPATGYKRARQRKA